MPFTGEDSRGRTYRDLDDPQRLLALGVYAESGSFASASRMSGVPETTIKSWVDAEDGIQTIEDLRLGIRFSTAHKYAAVANLALNELADRVANGDWVLDSDGVQRRVKMKGKDLAVVASIATDKHFLVSGGIAEGQKANTALRALADGLVLAMQGALSSSPLALPSTPTPPDAPQLG